MIVAGRVQGQIQNAVFIYYSYIYVIIYITPFGVVSLVKVGIIVQSHGVSGTLQSRRRFRQLA